jgi:hypothetical protein
MGKPPPNPKDPSWFPMKEAVDLRQPQTGDLETAIGDLQQDAANDELDIMRRNRVSNKCEWVAASKWKPHVVDVYLRLDGVPIKMDNQHKVADIYHRGHSDWLYYVWKPHFDRLYLGSARDDHDEPKGDGWQVARVKELLPIVFPDGVPGDATDKAVQKRLVPAFKDRGWKLPSLDTIARARGGRR